MTHRPLFTVFEGIDGSGTSTQIDLLMERLSTRGIEVVRTREPGGTPLGERVRNVVLDRSLTAVDPVAELLLYAASRRQHVQEIIGPALELGKPVICDRYADSTVAYQGGGRGLDMELVRRINDVAVGGCVPDVTVYVDVTVPEGDRRVRERPGAADRLEEEGQEFKQRVKQAFAQMAAGKGRESVWVDGHDGPAGIADSIYTELVSRWPQFPFGERMEG